MLITKNDVIRLQVAGVFAFNAVYKLGLYINEFPSNSALNEGQNKKLEKALSGIIHWILEYLTFRVLLQQYHLRR